jgi:carbamoyltransferase
MTILGLKLTHDGAMALIDNGKLIFSYEMEKLDNNERHSEFCIDLQKVNEVLLEYNYSLGEIDQLVIDGWGDNDLEIVIDKLKDIKIKVAEYGRILEKDDDVLVAEKFEINEYNLFYKSYKHIASHAVGAYCTSPFAGKKEDSFILVWDGGMPPQLLYYQYSANSFFNLGPLFLFSGFIYVDFSRAFRPFSETTDGNLSIAGKVMAYIALGKVNNDLLINLRRIFDEVAVQIEYDKVTYRMVEFMSREFIHRCKELAKSIQINHDDILATFHAFIQELIIGNLERKCKEYPMACNNLCFAGGSALNIKWNSGIRNSDIFENIWVPPFPNDAGSAVGTACCEMIAINKIRSLEWDVYSGPPVKDTGLEKSGYSVCACDIEELASILYNYNEPVVFLNGRAELGPRALGNRSILAPATSRGMKDLLNKIKRRENYRPVAPICLEEDAPDVFDPGFADPYMLFDHTVRQDWTDRVPAICHLDGSARLQTVSKNQNHLIYNLLTYYKRLSGIPLLCNTSANFNGKGFFPDVESVIKWGKVNFIWSNGRLYFKNQTFRPGESVKSYNMVINKE